MHQHFAERTHDTQARSVARHLIHKVVRGKPIQKARLNASAPAVETLVPTLAFAIRAALRVVDGVLARFGAYGAWGGSLSTTFEAFLQILSTFGALALTFGPGDEADAAADAEEDGGEGEYSCLFEHFGGGGGGECGTCGRGGWSVGTGGVGKWGGREECH